MKKIIFSNEANPISDFEVESAFIQLKDKELIFISNELLLNRFRLAYIKEEISLFELEVIEDNKSIIETIKKDGSFYEIWFSPVFKQCANFSSLIIKNKEKEIQINEEDCFSTIYFTKDAKSISDFDIENEFEKVKLNKEIFISNHILLDRFRLAVSNKEIKPFKFVLEDISEISTNKGYLKKSFHSENILNKNAFLVGSIWKTIVEKKEALK